MEGVGGSAFDAVRYDDVESPAVAVEDIRVAVRRFVGKHLMTINDFLYLCDEREWQLLFIFLESVLIEHFKSACLLVLVKGYGKFTKGFCYIAVYSVIVFDESVGV